ncbi:DUF305 domain-containing protein [Nocardia cyriacigeorgica]|uniref:DUF305 domain-containing protein n=1 Tax=Nocardia cyriacigeorgica TaxID=135487 RepID=A0A6P1D0V4_9NOCA|nr:DUF305 domain-containing protein [Nocardia cyriacigeorgica]NEW38012.1 DUF305 domain-containing protein [Nocardia cyriacigeorgica]NEW42920.1 DUF305 domain-containing protein [Nocardia cyriacigeorgica]NEW48605.1 DUF305 domain-containing protein [Nocardia cyriacigeorgica]NEW56235.1 DUF305 domain-containing protein [Nocardia cyriacigeorgica]
MPRGMRLAGYAAVAALLVVLGAALRPLVITDDRPADPVLDPVEIGFVQDMTAHHQQALMMVQRLDPAVDPAVSRLARQLADTQNLEIGTMLGWLRLANASPLSPQPMAWMRDAGVESGHQHGGPATAVHDPTGHSMPGMATMAELDTLSAARGRAAEILFLQLMLRHHDGGVAMAQAADQLIESGPVKETARSMIHGQSQESGVMAAMLGQRDAQPLP